MASPKLASFSVEENKLAEMAKALGHPARIAILKELVRRNSCVCGEIVEVLPLAQSTVSQHLKELKDAGLIRGTVEGAKSCYCINWENVLHLQDLIGAFAKSSETCKSCC
ncbi:MAG: winged helix-turn-helix transcriptional regulator [Chitinophagales bacterium]|nr:winged helix-turn-helix transcriptional regulator [Chitinophagales bacterium]